MVKLIVNKAEVQAKTGLNLIFSLVVLFIAGAIVIYLANRLFPASVVLGNAGITPLWALYHVAAKLAVIATAVIALVYYHEWKRGSLYTPREWMLIYFVVNTLAVWGISRLTDGFGFGISAWWVAVLLGAALDWAQGAMMMGLNKYLSRL